MKTIYMSRFCVLDNQREELEDDLLHRIEDMDYWVLFRITRTLGPKTVEDMGCNMRADLREVADE